MDDSIATDRCLVFRSYIADSERFLSLLSASV